MTRRLLPLSPSVRRVALFLAGAVLSLAVADEIVGWRVRRSQGKNLVGREVYLLQQQLRETDSRVRALYLGDSVARQLFPPGEEPEDTLRYLTSNQAVSVAGQYYLLRDALRAYPDTREVYLFYSVGAWTNNLNDEFTHDYFCGYFREFGEIAETFQVTHNPELLAVHLARALLPNLTALNSVLRVDRSRARPAGTALPAAAATVPEEVSIAPSEVSQVFLERIRALCRARNIALHVYPCPSSATYRFLVSKGVYDGPIFYLPADVFADRVHFKRDYVPLARQAVEARFHVRTPRNEGTPSDLAGVTAARDS